MLHESHPAHQLLGHVAGAGLSSTKAWCTYSLGWLSLAEKTLAAKQGAHMSAT